MHRIHVNFETPELLRMTHTLSGLKHVCANLNAQDRKKEFVLFHRVTTSVQLCCFIINYVGNFPGINRALLTDRMKMYRHPHARTRTHT